MKTLEVFYTELQASDELQNSMMEAALGGGLEEFFRGQGCEAGEDEIWNYFRERLMSEGELNDEELMIITGGADGQARLAKMLMVWQKRRA